MIRANDADDDHLFLPGLDRLAICDLDAVIVAKELWRRSQEIGIPLHGHAVLRVSRRAARRRAHRLSAAPHPKRGDRAREADCRQLGLTVMALLPAILVHNLYVGVAGFTL